MSRISFSLSFSSVLVFTILIGSYVLLFLARIDLLSFSEKESNSNDDLATLCIFECVQ